VAECDVGKICPMPLGARRASSVSVPVARGSRSMCEGGDDLSDAAGEFARLREEVVFGRGWGVVRGALPPDVVRAFVAQVEAELAAPCIIPRGEARPPRPVALSDASTWPGGSARRVVECVPPGAGPHWDAILGQAPGCPRLAAALDALLGPDSGWSIPGNQTEGGACGDRHWYVPVVFPEEDMADAGAPRDARDARVLAAELDAYGGRGAEVASGPEWGEAEDAALLEARDRVGDVRKMRRIAEGVPGRTRHACRVRLEHLLAKRAAQTAGDAGDARDARDAGDAERSWVPVNRRRKHWRGWHVDSGTGFPPGAMRTVKGQVEQGCVLLVLLSECKAGGGGTCVAAGSHRWVAGRLGQAGPSGAMSHEDLNAWAVDEVARRRDRGQLRLPHEVCQQGGDPAAADVEVTVVDQVVGSAGDVVFMHPLAVHCGTINCRRTPRIMANGMVRAGLPSAEGAGCCGMPHPGPLAHHTGDS